MELICLGSSSRGNGYILKGSAESLVVECGLPLMEVKEALDFKVGAIAGCVVSHRHRDHARHLPEYLECGIRVLALEDVFASFSLKDRTFCKTIQPMRGYIVGGFKVFALPVVHDVPCVGFVIEHVEMGRLLFVTDTMMLEYRVPGLDHIMLEANYSDEILEANIASGIVEPSRRGRLLGSHMEIRTTEQILRTTDLSSVNEVVLIHLSDSNSDAGRFRAQIKRAVGKPVHVAYPSFQIDISKSPY